MRKPASLQRLNLRLHRAVRRYREAPGRRFWLNVVMKREVLRYFEALERERLSCIEVSGDLHGDLGWKRYRSTTFPAFDLCDPPTIDVQYDVVVCEQVLEHVPDPIRAVRTLHDLAVPGGRVVINTPFLIRVHGHPNDYWRFTENGLRLLIETSGLQVDQTGSWGNRAAVRASLWRWTPYRPWHSLRDNPEVPTTVWAFCTRPATGPEDRDAPVGAPRPH